MSPKTSVLLTFLFATVLTFQNCGQGFQSYPESYRSVAQSIDAGPSSDGFLAEDAEALNCAQGPGMLKLDCIPLDPANNLRACQVPNGVGTQIKIADEWSSCSVSECSPGYNLEGNRCVFIEQTRSCSVANGTGQQLNTGQGFGACQLESCSRGYRKTAGKCVFKPIEQACTIANGVGAKTNSGQGFGSCQVQSCNRGYIKKGNSCQFIPVTRSCSISNGTGQQTNTGNGFGGCTLKKCNSGYHLSNKKCVFTPVKRSCSISSGQGEKTNTGSGFGSCQVKSCNSGYRKSGNKCVFKTVVRSCKISNGTGEATNTGSGFGSCKVDSCNSGYRKSSNKCVSNTRSCSIFKGKGSQVFKSGRWGACSIKSCNSGFKAVSSYKICVKKTAPTAKVRFFVLRDNGGKGNAIWTHDYVKKVTKQATIRTGGEVLLVTDTYKNIKSSIDYNEKKQKTVGLRNKDLAQFTKISALISNPKPTGSAGTALNISSNFEPYFVMQSRIKNGSAKDINSTAAILLHELGHNMGMTHDYGNKIHMDNHYEKRPQTLVNFIKDLNECKSERCQYRHQKFSNGVGTPHGR